MVFKAICNGVGEKKLSGAQLLSPNINLCLLCCHTIKSDLSNIEINENKLIQVTQLRKYVPAVITKHILSGNSLNVIKCLQLFVTKSNISLCCICQDYLRTMDEFATLCLNAEAKINIFTKMNKFEGKVNLHRVLECMEEYKSMDENELHTLSNIKEEIEIEIDELKPNIGRFLNKYVKYNCLSFKNTHGNYTSLSFTAYSTISNYGVSFLAWLLCYY